MCNIVTCCGSQHVNKLQGKGGNLLDLFHAELRHSREASEFKLLLKTTEKEDKFENIEKIFKFPCSVFELLMRITHFVKINYSQWLLRDSFTSFSPYHERFHEFKRTNNCVTILFLLGKR